MNRWVLVLAVVVTWGVLALLALAFVSAAKDPGDGRDVLWHPDASEGGEAS